MSHRESSNEVNEPAIISTTRLHKSFAGAIYESVDPDEIQYTKPDAPGAPTVTAISMQENPAYEINKAKTTT